MAFDFKKEYRDLYQPKCVPGIVTVPSTNYIGIRGHGNPNEEGGAYKEAVGVLFFVAYTLKMSYKTDYRINGFYEYVVPPLEGFWKQDGASAVDFTDKDAFDWVSVIRLPEFIIQENVKWAADSAERKKKLDCSAVEFLTIDEGLCVQIMHIGPFDTESESVRLMDRFIEENGYVNDISEERLHHEIYLSDVNKVSPEKWKTVIRHPIRKK